MTPPAMRVEVLLFAHLRELTGWRSGVLEVSPGATARTAWEVAVDRWPRLAGADGSLRVAVNEGYAAWDTVLRDGDVVAFLPPVAGGAAHPGRVHVLLTDDPIDARACEELIHGGGDGGVCTFTGVVRSPSGGRTVEAVEYQAYRSMAEREMKRVGEEALAASGASAVVIHHRTGRLGVGAASVVVSAGAIHRAEAFACCRHAIDALKDRVPIWKREVGEGGALWVGGAAQEGHGTRGGAAPGQSDGVGTGGEAAASGNDPAGAGI